MSLGFREQLLADERVRTCNQPRFFRHKIRNQSSYIFRRRVISYRGDRWVLPL